MYTMYIYGGVERHVIFVMACLENIWFVAP
jgi:hypothetical protein